MHLSVLILAHQCSLLAGLCIAYRAKPDEYYPFPNMSYCEALVHLAYADHVE